jgi:hypothetical protein
MRKSIRFKTVLVLSLLSSLATAQTATDVTFNGCVGTTDIAASAVTTGRIADRTIQASDLATGVVNSDKIADGTIKRIDLANGAVTSVKIKDGDVAFIDLSPDVNAFLGAAIANLSTLKVTGSAPGVAGAVCPSNRLPISASCGCNSENGSRNLGVLNGSSVTGDGAVGLCYYDGLSYNPLLPAPVTVVTAVCLGAQSYDGTPWVPLSTGLTADGTESQRSKITSVDEAEWIKNQHNAYEAALIELQNQYSIYSNRLPRQ